MSIRSLTFQVVALVAIPAFAAYHKATPYDFTFSSFAREGAITLRTEGEARGDDYHLGEETSTTEGATTIQTPVFDRAINVSHLVTEGQLKGDETVRPIAYIPQEITLTSIAIVTPGTVAPETLLLTLEGGKPHTLTLDRTKTPEAITLHGTWQGQGAVGTRSGFVHTYTVDQGDTITLNPGTEHSTFSVAFQSPDDPGQAQNRNVYLLDGRPYLRIAGKAELQHHIFKIDAAVNPDHSEAQSLAALLASDPAHSFKDDPNTVIVVEFEGEGGGINLDQEVLDSPLVFGSSVPSDKAHIHFPGKELITGAITFRDGASKGGFSIYGPTDTADYNQSLWDPHALLLRCDATLRTALPPNSDGWFFTHSTTIPAGRTVRIELAEYADVTNLPNLDFAAADSVLELALANNPRPPSKYTDLMTAQSGTLVLDQDVELAASLTLGGEGLESTVILRNGHTYSFSGPRNGGTGIVTKGGSVTLIQEGGTLTLGSASNAPLTLEAEETVIEVRGGTMTCETALVAETEGTNTALTVAEGATLHLNGGLPAGAEGTTATLDLTVKGTLNLGDHLNMLPALRRELRLEDGTLAATGAAVSVNCKDGAAAEVEDFMIVSGGGTLSGDLTVDGISGGGALTIEEQATVEDLRDFAGTVSGAGRLEAIEGTLGDVTLGDTWLANATGKKLGDVLTGWTEDGTDYHGAADFAGTIGFTAGAEGAQKTLDFSDLDELTSLGMAFRINNHQHIVMRLDQYADAVIRWPDNPEGITLTLIESGAYGGELTLPHFPHTEGDEGSGVKFEFATFNPGGGYTVRTDGYSHTHTEDGVNDTLVWDNPVFTGEGAWIDVEFNGDTYNTGWFTLGDYNGNSATNEDQRNRYNGLLGGDNIRREGDEDIYEVLTQGKAVANWGNGYTVDFTDSKHPEQTNGSLPLWYRPFVALGSLEYPEAWTVSLRMSAPNAARRCILALGHNYTGTTAGIPKYEGDVYSLIFATGESANEICLWVVPGLEGAGVSGTVERPKAPAFTVTLADATTAQHTFSVICDGTTLNLYVDGAWLGEHTLPGGHLSNGLQVGVQLGASSVPPAIKDGFADAVGVKDGGSIDFLRFYKGAMPASAMVEIADRTPYVRENLRYVRYVPIDTDPRGGLTAPEGGETWIQDGAWQAETWNGSAWVAGDYFDQPAEGAECRLLVAPGEYTLQVNVERQVTGEQDGDGETVSADHYFYSPNRNYAALVLAPQSGQTEAGTLRLTPLGVTAKEADDTGVADENQAWAQQVISGAWFTETATSTAANRTGFRYGTLRFTGGADDPINDAGTIPNFYGAGYLLSGSGLNADTESTTETSERVYSPAEPVWSDENIAYTFNSDWSFTESEVASGTAEQTAEQTYTYTVTTTTPSGYTVAPINGIYDAGICYLSKHALVVLKAAVGGGSTRVERRTGTRTWTRTADATRNTVERGLFLTHYEPANPPNNRVTGAWGTATFSDSKPEDETSEVVSETTEGASQLNTLTMVAGRSLTRGETAEVCEWQLTGPVVVEPTAAPDADPVAGHPALVEKDPDNDQASLDVWVPFFLGTDAWKFYDDTRTTAHGGDTNADGVTNGLFARGVQTPGRLYLDFTQGNKAATGLFSRQKWYRYGYEGEAASETVSGMAPIPATGTDYEQAVAFQIRLDSEIGDVTLTLDKLPTARVQTFYVEEEAGVTAPLTLKLLRAEGVDALPIWDTVVAAARLDVSNGKTGLASDSSWEGNALSLRPDGNASTRRTPVHRGNTSHDHGAYIVGTTQVDWDFGAASSVPRLEVVPGAELSFTVGQDFRTHGTTVVAQGKETSTFPKPEGSDAGPTADDLKTAAWIHHMSDAPFLGQDVELGEGAIFGFHAEAASSNADVQNEGVVLAGELRLTGNATLRADFESASGGAGAARLPHFVAAGGIHATKSGLTLIVDAPTHQSADGQGGTVDWHCHTATLTGDDFRLWKTGPGTMTFYANTPPSVTGKVTVEEGTLAVTTATDTPIGAKGLHIKTGATLADNGRMAGVSRRIARIPSGQILSVGVAADEKLKGMGATVKGILRLDSGAIYQAAEQGEVLTADGISVDGSLEANITVDLPKDYNAGSPYLKANREERNVRGRLLPMKDTERWDSIAWIDNGTTTTYAARPPQVPAPTDYAEGVPPGTIEGIIKEPLTNQYQNAGHAYIGATHGRTRAGTYALNPDELSDALLCFSNISAFVPASAIREGREYVDGTNFYVGYEFGISRQALVTIGATKYVVLEVSVESALEDSFPGVGFSDAQRNFEADFNSATRLSFDLIDAAGKAQSLDEDLVQEVTGMKGTPVASAVEGILTNRALDSGKRWFRIPLAELRKAAPDGNIRLRASATSPFAEQL